MLAGRRARARAGRRCAPRPGSRRSGRGSHPRRSGCRRASRGTITVEARLPRGRQRPLDQRRGQRAEHGARRRRTRRGDRERRPVDDHLVQVEAPRRRPEHHARRRPPTTPPAASVARPRRPRRLRGPPRRPAARRTPSSAPSTPPPPGRRRRPRWDGASRWRSRRCPRPPRRRSPRAAAVHRRRAGTTIISAIASDIATVAWPLGNAPGSAAHPSTRSGRSNVSFSTWVVRLAPSSTTPAATASRGRPRSSASRTIAPPTTASDATLIVSSSPFAPRNTCGWSQGDAPPRPASSDRWPVSVPTATSPRSAAAAADSRPKAASVPAARVRSGVGERIP